MLSPWAVEDLQWWQQHLTFLELEKSNFPSLNRLGCFTAGLGSHLWGEIDQRSQEQSLHINCLELLAATLGVWTFAKGKLSISILLRINNMTAVVYINRKGGDSVPNSLTSGKDTVVVVHGEKHLIGSPVPTRSHELRCRQGVQSLTRQIRVETLTENIPTSS